MCRGHVHWWTVFLLLVHSIVSWWFVEMIVLWQNVHDRDIRANGFNWYNVINKIYDDICVKWEPISEKYTLSEILYSFIKSWQIHKKNFLFGENINKRQEFIWNWILVFSSAMARNGFNNITWKLSFIDF